MKKHITFSAVSCASNTQVQAVSAAQLRQATENIAHLIAKVRNGDESAKRQLPAVCWAAIFADGQRHAESAEPTGLAYVDIDHISTNAQTDALTFWQQYFDNREDDFGIVHAQISPGGDGLHIIFVAQDGSSIEAAQADFAKRSGLPFYDAKCKDIARMLFLSSSRDTLFDALDTLYDVECETQNTLS